MAIVVEEHRSGGGGSGLINLMLWLVVLGILGAAVYYVFFAKPELVTVVGQSNFEIARQVSGLKLNVSDITGSAQFTALREHVTIPRTGEFGKANPFDGAGVIPIEVTQ